MNYKKLDLTGFYIGGFAHGSEAVEEIRKFAGEEGVKSGFFNVIGAVTEAVISFYDQQKKKYVEKPLNERMEIISCMGNVARKDGEVIVHAHVCFGMPDGSTIGGHLVSMKVFAGELHFFKSDEAVERGFDGKTGLNLMRL